MYLVNPKRKIILQECNTFGKRFIGFMFHKRKITTGKRFSKCNSIHTFFMFQEIDVIMTNRNNQIIKMYPNLKKGRIILPQKFVYYTYELPINTCKYYQIGHYLKIELEK